MERRAPNSEAIARRTAARPRLFHSEIAVNFTIQLAVRLIATGSLLSRKIQMKCQASAKNRVSRI
jgi:hypothetical protein